MPDIRFVFFNRTKHKANSLTSLGATWCDSPSDVAGGSEIILSMVSTSEVLKETALQAFQSMSTGKVYIDMSTVSPAVTQELADKFKNAGKHFLHCPVLGSIPQAADGSMLLCCWRR